MGRKFQKNSLTGEMISRLLLGLVTGLFLILLIGLGGGSRLKQYFERYGCYYEAEAGRAEELQEFVRRNNLAAADRKDQKALRRWAEERKLKEFMVFRGDLQGTVTVSGNNELSRLADSLEVMRRTLIQNEQTERELRQAQANLLLDMSHDLKTPLTALMAYMEIIRKQERAGQPAGEYTDKAFDKILQIRAHADRLFELFLIDSRTKYELEPAAEVFDALGDYLSEMLILLEADGFTVDTEMVDWQPVRIGLRYGADRVGVWIRNGVGDVGGSVEGTDIGVKNISMMMEQMGGKAEIEQGNAAFSVN